jgi:hypothetical protein
MLRPITTWLLTMVACLTLTVVGNARTWTDRKGRRVEADLVAIPDASIIRIKRSGDGQVFDVPLSSLSDADQEYVKSQAKATPESGAIPSGLHAEGKSKEIDTVTFIRAFAEGKADTYKGFLVRGGGAAPQATSTEGGGGSASVLVCGKRPDGTFYAITKMPDGNFNFEAFKDRLFAIKLVWLKTRMPKGYESDGMGFILHVPVLAERFQARFQGEYAEVTISQSGQASRKEKVPVLIWEDAAKSPK